MATNTIENPEKFRYCSHCGMKLLETAWEEHEKTCSKKSPTTDTGAIKKQYKCSHCASQFVKMDDLKKHEKVHKINQSNVTPFECCPCKKKFATLEELETHELSHPRKHSSDQAEKSTFKCQKCNQTFRNRFHHQQHM